MEFSAMVPLPSAVADNRAAAFAPVFGEAPLARVVRSLLPLADGIVVAAAEPLVGEARECLATPYSSSVTVVTGGDTRTECVAAGLEYLTDQPISPRYVLIHDIRWPLASADLAERVSAALRGGSAVALPTLPVTDSTKTIDVLGSITGTADRSALRSVQYPRGFTVGQLAELVARCTSEDFDELAEAIGAGAAVTLVDGDPDAFVAELPRDTRFVEAIIACRDRR